MKNFRGDIKRQAQKNHVLLPVEVNIALNNKECHPHGIMRQPDIKLITIITFLKGLR